MESTYLWRHNCVLLIQAKIQEVNSTPQRPTLPPITFVKAGKKVNSGTSLPLPRFGLLEEARDWTFNFDLPEFRQEESKFVFPHVVCATPLRIDGYVMSLSKKVCLAGPELTVPMEEWSHTWHAKKLDKYQELLDNKAEGWSVIPLAAEVGSRGFIPPSLVLYSGNWGLVTRRFQHLGRDVVEWLEM